MIINEDYFNDIEDYDLTDDINNRDVDITYDTKIQIIVRYNIPQIIKLKSYDTDVAEFKQLIKRFEYIIDNFYAVDNCRTSELVYYLPSNIQSFTYDDVNLKCSEVYTKETTEFAFTLEMNHSLKTARDYFKFIMMLHSVRYKGLITDCIWIKLPHTNGYQDFCYLDLMVEYKTKHTEHIKIKELYNFFIKLSPAITYNQVEQEYYRLKASGKLLKLNSK